MSWISCTSSLQTLITSTLDLHAYMLCLWRILADLPLRLGVDEATTAAVRLGRATASHSGRTVTTKLAAEAEEDGSEEVAGQGSPSEAHEVTTNTGLLPGRAEGIASLDDPDAGVMLVRCHVENVIACARLTSSESRLGSGRIERRK